MVLTPEFETLGWSVIDIPQPSETERRIAKINQLLAELKELENGQN